MVHVGKKWICNTGFHVSSIYWTENQINAAIQIAAMVENEWLYKLLRNKKYIC